MLLVFLLDMSGDFVSDSNSDSDAVNDPISKCAILIVIFMSSFC